MSGVGAAAAGVSQYSARTWQLEDGLPRNFIQAVVQTRDGYLWVGTQSGLARFDGVRFTVFDRSNVPLMANANVLGLLESRDGSLWVATGWGGVLRFQAGHCTRYSQSEGLASDKTLGPLYETRDGALWIATTNGLSRFKDGQFTTLGRSRGLSSDVVKAMCEDPEGTLWLATSKGVDCWQAGVVTRRLNQTNGLPTADVPALCCDAEGTLWLGSGDRLLCLRKDGQMDTFSPGNNDAVDAITCLFVDRHGTLWIGTQGGLSRFVDGKFVPEVNAEGLRYDLVKTVFEDRENNIWVGSREGLVRLRRKRCQIYGSQQGLSFNNVTSVLEDQAGTIWIGTWGGGLNRLDQGIITSLRPSASMPTVPALVLGLLEGGRGELWAGSDWGGGLYCLKGDALQHYALRHGLPDYPVRVLCRDRASHLWVGTGNGLYRFQGQKFTPFTAQGFGKPVVRALHEDREGNLWVGTEQGLWRIHGETATRFTPAQGLSQERVIAIHEDGQGTLWFGTGSGGLNRYQDGRFVAIGSRQGLFSDSVCEILEDDRGWFWMSCLRGIFRVRRADLEAVAAGRQTSLHCLAYGKADGMWTETCNSIAKPGAWKSKDGRLWFATLKGLCVIDPNEQLADEDCAPPPVVLERIFADKKPFPAQETLPVPESLRLPPGRGELEFHYTALGFQVPERNRFKYCLEGFDREWVDAGARRVAYYSNLGPGKYRFRVLGRNSDGVWNEAGAAVELVLLPHFWQTWWFRLAAAGGLGLGFLGLHGVRLARYRELEALRLRIATDLHDEVGSNLSALSLLSRKLLKDSAVAPEQMQDLVALNRIAGQTSNAIREIVWLINPEYDTLQDLTLRMEVTAKTMLGDLDCRFHCHQRDGAIRLPPQRRQSLYLLFKETVTNVAKHAQASQVDITIDQRDLTWAMVVQDNGLGFDPGVEHRGNGLKNLRLRAERLHGHLDIQSRPGAGTTVRFSLRLS